MQFASLSVFPAEAGSQQKQTVLDPGFRREDGNIVILRKSWYCVEKVVMDTVSYSGLRQNLAEYMDKVNGNHAPLLITRQNAPAAVLMSLADFKAYEETAYLMCSPVNAARLQDAVTQLEDNKGTLRVLIGE